MRQTQRHSTLAQTTPTLVASGRMAEALGVSVQTLYRWEKQGHITAERTPAGHRRYDLELVKSQALKTRGAAS